MTWVLVVGRTEGISPEIEQALENMNWEDRLKKARAQREAVLKAREEEARGTEKSARAQPVSAVSVAANLRFGDDGDDLPPTREPSHADRFGRTRFALIGLSFFAGLCFGALFMGLGGSILQREPVSLAEDRAGASEEASLAAAPSVRTAQTTNVPAVAEVAPILNSAASVLPEVEPETDASASLILPRSPSGFPRETSGFEVSELLGIAEIDALPVIDAPSQRPSVAAEDRLGPPAPSLSASRPTLPLAGADIAANEIRNFQHVAANGHASAASGAGNRHLPANQLPLVGDAPVTAGGFNISDPEQPTLMASLTQTLGRGALPPIGTAAARVEVSSFDDVSLSGTASEPAAKDLQPDGRPAADSNPPVPMIPGAEEIRVWIFAPSTVEDNLLEDTKQVLAALKLQVRDVYTVDFGISETQVRFYHATSAEAANRLAEEMGAVARDFTNLETDLLPGGLEIYLAGTVATVATPRPAPTAAVDSPKQILPPQEIEADNSLTSVISRFLDGVFR